MGGGGCELVSSPVHATYVAIYMYIYIYVCVCYYTVIFKNINSAVSKENVDWDIWRICTGMINKNILIFVPAVPRKFSEEPIEIRNHLAQIFTEIIGQTENDRKRKFLVILI